MLSIELLDLQSKKSVQQFISFPFKLYEKVPQWVPPFITDQKTMLNPAKHPFYEHSVAEFFIAKRDGEVVGRIAAIENVPYNRTHDVKKAQFYFFDSIDDQAVADALFARTFEWAKKRGLDTVSGPKGLSAFDGYGIQIEGAEHRQMMTMMNYNFPYYQSLVENFGFVKDVDFVSCHINNDNFNIPEKAQLIADRVRERGKFKVVNFSNKRELKKWVKPIGIAYNKTFVHNWEYYPLTEREIQFSLDDIMMVADPKLIKVIMYNDQIVGFLFAFPDVSAALQRQKGKITPWGIVDIMREFKKTTMVSLNGAGVLPEYQGGGGNALLYSEMAETLKSSGQFTEGELTQVAETTQQMRKDLITMGGKPYKNHRVYQKKI
jgi:GNAT superfamily N-acetyltransferase